ncbi:MAG: hypothetical protein ACK4ND_18585, partial [Cytophagaceae bacterium]
MSGYRIIDNYKAPSKEEISQNKNFDAFLLNFKKQELRARRIKYTLVSIVIVLIAALILFIISGTNEEIPDKPFLENIFPVETEKMNQNELLPSNGHNIEDIQKEVIPVSE